MSSTACVSPGVELAPRDHRDRHRPRRAVELPATAPTKAPRIRDVHIVAPRPDGRLDQVRAAELERPGAVDHHVAADLLQPLGADLVAIDHARSRTRPARRSAAARAAAPEPWPRSRPPRLTRIRLPPRQQPRQARAEHPARRRRSGHAAGSCTRLKCLGAAMSKRFSGLGNCPASAVASPPRAASAMAMSSSPCTAAEIAAAEHVGKALARSGRPAPTMTSSRPDASRRPLDHDLRADLDHAAGRNMEVFRRVGGVAWPAR